LRQTQQSESRLGVTTELVDAAVGLLRRGKVASAPADLADLVEAGRRGPEVVAADFLARRDRLPLRLRPVAAQAQGLGTMDPADAREPADVLPVAPAVRLRCPFSRAAIIAQVLAGRDHDAVDDSGRKRRQLARQRRGRRFVEQFEAFRDLALEYVSASAEDERERLQLAVAETLPDLERFLRVLEDAVDVAAQHRLQRAADGQVPVFDRLGLVGQQTLRAPEPSLRDRHGSLPREIVGQLEGDQRRGSRLTRIDVRGERLLPVLDGFVEPACPPPGVGDGLEILGRQSV
jgi:hypothetical protein